MNNYFYKMTTFDVDKERLFSEWHTVATKHNLFRRNRTRENFVYRDYYKMFINYPTDRDENFDPVLEKGRIDQFGNNDFKIENIIKDFKNSHTAEVATMVHAYLTPKIASKYRINAIKYHVLGPRSSLSRHIDGSVEPRFFLIASVSEGCYMEVLDDRIPMHETGSLFRMITTVRHNPVNDTDDYRVTMVFDVLPI